MTSQHLAHLRFRNQQISGTNFTNSEELVSWMGCMQAQDYGMAKWAIGCRLIGVTDAGVEKDFNEGKILRTHILRPTWHFVSPRDIRWMLKLTGPKIKAFTKSHHQKLGIDYAVLKRSKTIIEKALVKNDRLTRKELQSSLAKGKVNTDDERAGFLLLDAELDGLICSAGRKGKQFAYGLLDGIVPEYKIPTQEESLAELTRRYFTSHGPATVNDFSWWSGLSLTDARTGLGMNKKVLISEDINGQTYWFANLSSIANIKSRDIYLLPAFDEYFISYKDRSAFIEPGIIKEVMTRNGIFYPIIVQNGKIIGVWKRTTEKGRIWIKLNLFDSANKSLSKAIASSSKKYGAYTGKRIHIEITS